MNDELDKNKKDSFEVRVENCEKDLVEIEKKYGLKVSAAADFPVYKQLPVEVQLAVMVLERHGIVFVRKFIDSEVKDAN